MAQDYQLALYILTYNSLHKKYCATVYCIKLLSILLVYLRLSSFPGSSNSTQVQGEEPVEGLRLLPVNTTSIVLEIAISQVAHTAAHKTINNKHTARFLNRPLHTTNQKCVEHTYTYTPR